MSFGEAMEAEEGERYAMWLKNVGDVEKGISSRWEVREEAAEREERRERAQEVMWVGGVKVRVLWIDIVVGGGGGWGVVDDEADWMRAFSTFDKIEMDELESLGVRMGGVLGVLYFFFCE